MKRDRGATRLRQAGRRIEPDMGLEGGERRLPPSTRAAMVADELRRLILSGECAPGARLRQAELAKQLGVSTTPVREAFTALALEGLVRQDPHRGVIVFEFGIDELNENYEIRLALEPLATQLAAPRINAEDISGLNALIAQMRIAKGSAGYHALNRRLHTAIYTAAGRPRLHATIESLRDAAEAYYLRLNDNLPGRTGYVEQVHGEHERIVASLARGHAEAASQSMWEHLEHNRLELEKILSSSDGDRLESGGELRDAC